MADAAQIEAELRDALTRITDPASGRDIVAAGLVHSIALRGERLRLILELPRGTDPRMAEGLKQAVEEATAGVDALEAYRDRIDVLVTAASESPAASGGAPAEATPPKAPARGTLSRGPLTLPGVTDIIAIASGKGGVGKSTVAVNLALALARQGKRVGLLDADIYGPSIPHMLNLKDAPEPEDNGEKKLRPAGTLGLKVMSIGLMVDTETPMIWRGPMVASAIAQMLGDVDWGELDILVVDMPPGTGDAQLTMAQRVPLSGAVIVSTPQEVALIDARKGLAMFQRTHVPVLGIVENMAWFETPGTGERNYIFGDGGARRTADLLGCPFLGEIPIMPRIREFSDLGTPVVSKDPEGAEAAAFHAIAARAATKLKDLKRQPPKIVIV